MWESFNASKCFPYTLKMIRYVKGQISTVEERVEYEKLCCYSSLKSRTHYSKINMQKESYDTNLLRINFKMTITILEIKRGKFPDLLDWTDHIWSFLAPIALHDMPFYSSPIDRNNCMCSTFMRIEPVEIKKLDQDKYIYLPVKKTPPPRNQKSFK